MAYREFHSEPTYEAPEISGLLNNTLDTLQSVMMQKVQERRQNRAAAQRFKLDSQKGFYASDQDALDDVAKTITQRAVNELRNSGNLSSDTSLMMEDYKGLANRSKIDYDTAQNVRKQITALAGKDKYYNPKSDNDRLINAEYEGGIDGRNDRIQGVAQSIGGLETFNKGRFLSDYIQQQKLNTLQQVTDQSGVKTTKMTSSIFMKPDGQPGVTDTHIVDYINRDPRIEQWYNNEADKQLTGEVTRMRALGNDPRVAWMKDMSDEDVKTALVENPSLNVINSTPFAARKKELARQDLEAAQDLNRKTAIDYSDQYNANGGKFKNTKIGYQPTNIQQAINFKTLNGARNAGTVGADLTYVDKGGPIKFVTNSPIRANVGTGQVDTKASDNVEFNLSNYGLQIYDDKGQLYPMQGNNLDELKKSIDAIPDRYFDPNSAHPISEMAVALNGYAVNKSKLINQSLDKRGQLAEQYNTALDDGDEIKAGQLQSRMNQIDQLRSMSGNADVDDLQLLLLGKQLGISGIQNDLIVKATDQDFSKLKTITNGLDLRNRESWTEDMKELKAHFDKRKAEAQQALQSPAKPKPKPKSKSITPEEFNQKWATLKAGEKLVGPDGKTYTKK